VHGATTPRLGREGLSVGRRQAVCQYTRRDGSLVRVNCEIGWLALPANSHFQGFHQQ
jgi:hypothetical protein